MTEQEDDPDAEVIKAAEAFLHAIVARNLSLADEILTSVKVQTNWVFSRTVAAERAAEALAGVAVESADVTERLTALALFGRLDALTNRKITTFVPHGERAASVEPPRLVIDRKPALDAKARGYICSVVRDYAQGPWLVDWAARALVDETNSPTVREDLATLILDRSDNVASAFGALTSAVPGSLLETPITKEPEITRTRQAARVLAALQPALRLSQIETGQDLAEAANAMIRALLLRFKAPKGEAADALAATSEAVVEGLGLLQTLVRTRFSISIQTESYALLRPIQIWSGGSWPEDTAAARAGLARSVREAIALQARMQLVSRELLSALILLKGDREAALKSLEPLSRMPGLQPEVQMWLASGNTTQQAPRKSSSGEGAWREADSLLAQASARAARLRSVIDRDGAALVKAIRSHPNEAGLGNAATLLVNVGRAVTQTLVLTMTKRGLELFDTPGDRVEFVPARHEASDGSLIDSQLVEVLEPGALRRGPTGAEDVIRKAIVRPVRD